MASSKVVATAAATKVNGNDLKQPQVYGYLDVLSLGGDIDRTYVISSTKVTIGRDSKADVRFEGMAKMSRNQCELLIKPAIGRDRVYDAMIHNLSTKRTTFLCGKVIEHNVRAGLEPDADLIKVVTQDLKWRYYNPTDPAGPLQAGPAPLVHIPPISEKRTVSSPLMQPSSTSKLSSSTSSKSASPAQLKSPAQASLSTASSSASGRSSLPARQSTKSPSPKSHSRRRSADMRTAVLKKSFKLSVQENKGRRSTKLFQDIPGTESADMISEENDEEDGDSDEDKSGDDVSSTSNDLIRFTSPLPESNVSFDLIQLDEEPMDTEEEVESSSTTNGIEMIGTESPRVDPEELNEEPVGENGEENGNDSYYFSVRSDTSDTETNYTSFVEANDATVSNEEGGEEDVVPQEVEVPTKPICAKFDGTEVTFAELEMENQLHTDLPFDDSFDDDEGDSVYVNLGSTVNNNATRSIDETLNPEEGEGDTQGIEFSYLSENEIQVSTLGSPNVVACDDVNNEDAEIPEAGGVEHSFADLETQVFDTDTQDFDTETQVLETEAQALKSDTQAMNSEIQAFDSENHALHLETQVLDSETQVLDSETQVFDSETQVLDSETQALDSETLALVSDTKALDSETQALVADAQALDSDSETQALVADTQALDSDSETQALVADTQALDSDSETQALVSETLDFDPETQVLDSEAHVLDSKTQTLESEAQTLDSETLALDSETQVLDSETLDLDSETQSFCSDIQILDPDIQILNSGTQILDDNQQVEHPKPDLSINTQVEPEIEEGSLPADDSFDEIVPTFEPAIKEVGSSVENEIEEALPESEPVSSDELDTSIVTETENDVFKFQPEVEEVFIIQEKVQIKTPRRFSSRKRSSIGVEVEENGVADISFSDDQMTSESMNSSDIVLDSQADPDSNNQTFGTGNIPLPEVEYMEIDEDEPLDTSANDSMVDPTEEMNVTVPLFESQAGNDSSQEEENSFNIEAIEEEMKQIFGDAQSSEGELNGQNGVVHSTFSGESQEEAPVQNQPTRRSSRRASSNAALPMMTSIRTPRNLDKTPSMNTPIPDADGEAHDVESEIQDKDQSMPRNSRQSSNAARPLGTPIRSPKTTAKTPIPEVGEVELKAADVAEAEDLPLPRSSRRLTSNAALPLVTPIRTPRTTDKAPSMSTPIPEVGEVALEANDVAETKDHPTPRSSRRPTSNAARAFLTPIRTPKTTAKTPSMSTPIPEVAEVEAVTETEDLPMPRSSQSPSYNAARPLGTLIQTPTTTAKTPSMNTPIPEVGEVAGSNDVAETEDQPMPRSSRRRSSNAVRPFVTPIRTPRTTAKTPSVSTPIPEVAEVAVEANNDAEIEDQPTPRSSRRPTSNAVRPLVTPIRTPRTTAKTPSVSAPTPEVAEVEVEAHDDAEIEDQPMPRSSRRPSSTAARRLGTPFRTPKATAKIPSVSTPIPEVAEGAFEANDVAETEDQPIPRSSRRSNFNVLLRAVTLVRTPRNLAKTTSMSTPIGEADDAAEDAKVDPDLEDQPMSKSSRRSRVTLVTPRNLAKTPKKNTQISEADVEAKDAATEVQFSLIESCNQKRLSVTLERVNVDESMSEPEMEAEKPAYSLKKVAKKAGRPVKTKRAPKKRVSVNLRRKMTTIERQTSAKSKSITPVPEVIELSSDQPSSAAPKKVAKKTTRAPKKRVSVTLRRKTITIGTQTSSKSKSITPVPEVIELSGDEASSSAPKKVTRKTKVKETVPKPARATVKRKREPSEQPDAEPTDTKTTQPKSRGKPRSRQAKEVEAEAPQDVAEPELMPKKGARRLKHAVLVEAVPPVSVETPKKKAQKQMVKAPSKRRGKKTQLEASPPQKKGGEVDDDIQIVTEIKPVRDGRKLLAVAASTEASSTAPKKVTRKTKVEETVPKMTRATVKRKREPSEEPDAEPTDTKTTETQSKRRRARGEPVVNQVEVETQPKSRGKPRSRQAKEVEVEDKVEVEVEAPQDDAEPELKPRKGARRVKQAVILEEVPPVSVETPKKKAQKQMAKAPSKRRGKQTQLEASPPQKKRGEVDDAIQIVKEIKPVRGGRKLAAVAAPTEAVTESDSEVTEKAPEKTRRALRSRK